MTAGSNADMEVGGIYQGTFDNLLSLFNILEDLEITAGVIDDCCVLVLEPMIIELHAFFISNGFFRPRLGLLLNKNQLFRKFDLPYLTKCCLKCYLG